MFNGENLYFCIVARIKVQSFNIYEKLFINVFLRNIFFNNSNANQ